nr:hypothetical protein [Candidatus Acidoferrales bacterium]
MPISKFQLPTARCRYFARANNKHKIIDALGGHTPDAYKKPQGYKTP